ncbi:MAG TPA: hypothetical protein VLK25_11140, partial [Allosphingosinicella sp.]|nr:hypothetical protein [Allosphingosinicella sp.]
MISRWSLLFALALCACTPTAEQSPPVEAPKPAPAAAPTNQASDPSADRRPVSEAPFTPESAQGAANVVQTYFALLEAGRHEAALGLWSDGGRAADRSAA